MSEEEPTLWVDEGVTEELMEAVGEAITSKLPRDGRFIVVVTRHSRSGFISNATARAGLEMLAGAYNEISSSLPPSPPPEEPN